jgi:hypothetical protein
VDDPAQELDEEDILNLTKNISSTWLGNSERLQLMRVIVGFSHLTAKQVPRFLRCFDTNSVELVLAAVACFGSLTDSHNFIHDVLSALPPHVVRSPIVVKSCESRPFRDPLPIPSPGW